MKKLTLVAIVVLLVLAVVPMMVSAQDCTTIQSGELVDKVGTPITTGYDQWGYNYQAHMFNGLYCNYNRPADVCGDDTIQLSMKWNDAWLSNKSCDGDLKLDRHYGYLSYIGSGAWLTNHEVGTYDQDGETCAYDYFVKIIAAPEGAKVVDGYWVGDDGNGTVIGPVIWGDFAITQEVWNDPCAELEGLFYASPDRLGLGNW